MTRKRPSPRASSSNAHRRSVWRSPTRPVAMNGAEATAEETPISATWPLRRMKGKSALPICSASSLTIHGAQSLRNRSMHAGHIGVVVAGDRGDAVGRSELLEPGARILEFLAHGDVGEVAGDDDMVRLLRLADRRPAGRAFRRSRRWRDCAASWVADDALRGVVAQPEIGTAPRCTSERWPRRNIRSARASVRQRRRFLPRRKAGRIEISMKAHHRWRQRAYLAYARLSRGMTLGVRGLLIKDDRVVLVKHSYVPGWYLPGGGVEPGESARRGDGARGAGGGGRRAYRSAAALRHLPQQQGRPARSRRALCLPRFRAEHGTPKAQPRDHRLRSLPARRAARRHHAVDTRAHPRGALRRDAGAPIGDMVSGWACPCP